MSRCFPYPPPGYVRGEISLAESIKLQKEKVQEERKKEKKREHKEKKDKKKRSRGDFEQTVDEKQFGRKRHFVKDTKSNQEVPFLPEQKVQFLPEEQLEKSGVTEELGLPHLPYRCGSPDSCASEDSSKRRRVGDSQTTHVSQATGLRIRFALAKPKPPEVAPVAPANTLKLPVAVPAVEGTPAAARSPFLSPSPAKQKKPEVVRLPLAKDELGARELCEQPSFSGRAETSTSQDPSLGEDLLLPEGYRGCKKSRKKEAKFNDLFLNWAPPSILQLSSELQLSSDDDQDWLLNTCRPARPDEKSVTVSCSDRSISSDSSVYAWPPRAHHLEEADVYALPYVVPF